MMVKKLRITAIILLLINALGALWGGAGLVYDPSGEFMQMPLELIKHSPFDNYFFPGIILFVFNGLICLAIAVAAIKKVRYYSLLIAFQGLVLATWLSVQIIMIQIFFPPLHLPFYIIAAILVLAGFLLRNKGQ
jgi:hypothetical protein